MPHDPERVAETRAWLLKVEQDLHAADSDRNADPPVTADMVFHAQQAAEKCMKGFLTWHDYPFRKTHDLAELGVQCVGVDPSFEDVCRRAERLTVYAWIFRYPGEPEEPPLEEADQALRLAREVYEAVLERLPEEAKP